MESKRSIYEIELGIAYLADYDFTKNLVVFNVNGDRKHLNLGHECDVLVCTSKGYLTEIEIKRSFSDFLADFKKYELHAPCGIISNFYYCVSSLFADRVIKELVSRNVDCDGVFVYDEGESDIIFKYYSLHQASEERKHAKPISIESQLYLAKLGCMRQISFRRKMVEHPQTSRQHFIPLYPYCIKTNDE